MSDNSDTQHPACARCRLPREKKVCLVPESGVGAKGCPTLEQKEALDAANAAYRDDPELLHFAQEASRQEASCYANRHERPYVEQPSKTRIVEICEFAKRMGYRRLGLAFCIGLAKEAGMVDDILRDRGFEVVSVMCKAGATPKEYLDLHGDDKIVAEKFEPVCNPVNQAELVNREGTEFNIVLGLCVGHDSMFFMRSKAPITVLAVKDRVTGHNPLAAIYTSHSYYRKIKQRKED